MLPHRARRRALAVTAVLACLGGVAACGSRGAPELTASPHETMAATLGLVERAPRQRPNMLVIETDDMRWDDLRFMPAVRHLIQDRGLTFENSFAPSPLCAPSRASFLSGEYAHNHDVYTHVDPYGFAAFRDGHTIATTLQGDGYRTAMVGKYINGYGEQLLPSGAPSLHYEPPGWDEWYAGSDHEWNYDDPNYGGGTYSYDHLVENVDGTIRAFPGRYSTDVVAEQARGVISGFSRGRDPWFVWWTPTAPHAGLPVEADDPQPTRRLDGQFESGRRQDARTGSRAASTASSRTARAPRCTTVPRPM